jgi:transcriptional regulator with XRE-family HTH domain
MIWIRVFLWDSEALRVDRHANGKLIKQAREQLGVQLVDMAHGVGISAQDLLQIEAGKQLATGTQVVHLADWLQINPEQFYDAPADEGYRGNRTKVGGAITEGATPFGMVDVRPVDASTRG